MPGYHQFQCHLMTEKNGVYSRHKFIYLFDKSPRSLYYIPSSERTRLIAHYFSKITEEAEFKVIKPVNSVKLHWESCAGNYQQKMKILSRPALKKKQFCCGIQSRQIVSNQFLEIGVELHITFFAVTPRCSEFCSRLLRILQQSCCFCGAADTAESSTAACF